MDQTQTQLTLSLVKLFPLAPALSIALSICYLLAAKTEIGDRNTCVVWERERGSERESVCLCVYACCIIKTPLRTFVARV